MPYRNIPEEIRIKATQELLKHGIEDRKVVAEIAKKYDVSIDTLLKWFKEIHDGVPEMIKKKKPGPKSDQNVKTSKVEKIDNKNLVKKGKDEISDDVSCPKCGSGNVVKNGTCKIKNWFNKAIFTFLLFVCINNKINTETIRQKYYCNDCNISIKDNDWISNNDIKDIFKVEIVKLICKLRFKHHLSIRTISDIIKAQYGFNFSVGHISQVCTEAGERALEMLFLLNKASQNEAKVIMLDETFPKTKAGTRKIGVIVDENGLIRGVKVIYDKKIHLTALIKKVLEGGQYNPKYFMSDYDKTYPGVIKDLIPEIIIMKDFVHALRKYNTKLSTALRKVKVKGISDLTKTKQKQLLRLKRRLLRNQVERVIYKFILSFKFKNAPVGSLYIEAGLSDLKKLVEKFPSLESYYEKVVKFINTYINTWVRQMEICYNENLPLTSNMIKSRNSILKISSKVSKSYSNNRRLECHFAAVSLMENFDIKTRGKNKGTSAIIRAGINLEEYGANNFYEAINITEIALGKGKTCNVKVDVKKMLHKAA